MSSPKNHSSSAFLSYMGISQKNNDDDDNDKSQQ